MFVKTKTTGLVLDERLYLTTPPDAFEDRSRWRNNGGHTNITWVQLPSGLWVRSFNGATSRVNCGNDASLSFGAGSLSAVGWFKTTIAASQRIVNKGDCDAGATGWGLTPRADGRVWWITGIGGERIVQGTKAHNDGRWHLAVGVTKYGDKMSIIVDGVLEATLDISGFVGSSNSVRDCTIGVAIMDNIGALAEYFNGLIGEVRIYNYALSLAQIRKRFEATRTWYGV